MNTEKFENLVKKSYSDWTQDDHDQGFKVTYSTYQGMDYNQIILMIGVIQLTKLNISLKDTGVMCLLLKYLTKVSSLAGQVVVILVMLMA